MTNRASRSEHVQIDNRNYRLREIDTLHTEVRGKSPFAARPSEYIFDMPINALLEGIREWQQGTLIQRALPTLSASEREFLMTGLTDDEWDDIFSYDDDTSLQS